MRVGVATRNGTQAGIMTELLAPFFGDIKVYSQAEMDSGEFLQSNEHILIIDYSDESIMDMECVLEMIERDEPKSIMSEKNLYPLQHDERLAWRTKIVREVTRLLPDLAGEISNTSLANRGGDVWVIGSSSGGPDALTNLLSSLPKLPISLIITQHIGSDKGSISLQTVLNSRQTNWSVKIATDGMELSPGYAYIVKRDTVVSIDDQRLSVKNFQLPNQPSPSINATIRAVRRTTTAGVGVIILSGLGDDGSAALKEIKHKTLLVLAQDAEGCAARSMPDSARQAGVVDESHTPEGLAKRLAKHYGVGVV